MFADETKLFPHTRQESDLITAAVCYTRAKAQSIAPSALDFAPMATSQDLTTFTEDIINNLLVSYHAKFNQRTDHRHGPKPVIGTHAVVKLVERAGMKGILSHKIFANYLVELVLGRVAYRILCLKNARAAASNVATISDVVRNANEHIFDSHTHLAVDQLVTLAMSGTQFLRGFRMRITDEDFADLRLLGIGTSDINRNGPETAPVKNKPAAPLTPTAMATMSRSLGQLRIADKVITEEHGGDAASSSLMDLDIDVRCDPSHKKRLASQSSSPDARPAKKSKKLGDAMDID